MMYKEESKLSEFSSRSVQSAKLRIVQHKVNKIMNDANVIVAKGNNFLISNVLPPPRGSLDKGAEKRKKVWYDHGPASKRCRVYVSTRVLFFTTRVTHVLNVFLLSFSTTPDCNA